MATLANTPTQLWECVNWSASMWQLPQKGSRPVALIHGHSLSHPEGSSPTSSAFCGVLLSISGRVPSICALRTDQQSSPPKLNTYPVDPNSPNSVANHAFSFWFLRAGSLDSLPANGSIGSVLLTHPSRPRPIRDVFSPV